MRAIPKKMRDPQRMRPVDQCARCGGELYLGCPCWKLSGRTLCEECVVPWLLAELAPFHAVGGEVGP